MKKFFALLVTVAMLLVAGSAMAADPTLTLSSTTASVQAGTSTPVTVTATATAGNRGTLGAITVSGADWATVSGNTITLAPGASVTAGSYPITVSVVETYTDGAAGHSTKTATATATLNVTVTAASAGTTIVVKIVDGKAKAVVVTVDEHGNVTETVIEAASPDVENRIASATGVTSISIVPVSACANVPEATIKTDDAAADEASVHVAARTVAFNDLPNGVYYFPITFKSLGVVGVTVSGDFEFYPDGYSAGTTAFVRFFDAKGNEITDPASVLAATSSDVKGYIAFEIENGGIKVADADNTFANPTVGIAMKAVTPTPTPTPTPTSDDAVLNDLVTKGYVRGTTITDAGFAEKVTFSGTVYTGTVKLNFPVQPSSWTVSVAGNGSIKASAIGAITNATSTQATITLNKAEITEGTHAVTLSVLPTNAAGTAAAKTPVTASLGSVVGNPGLVGVGSSSGGCSAESAVLALALLGVFIARKK